MDKLDAECKDCQFRTIFCKELSEKDFLKLSKRTSRVSYQKGEVILKQGVEMHQLVYLTKGKIKFHYNNNGKNLIITIDKAPTLLGLANILNKDVNAFSIYAIENCTGCLIDLNMFKMFIIQNRKFMLEIMNQCTSMFQKSIFNFISLAHKQVNGRMADILLYLSEYIYENNSFNLSLSRQELAEFAGCSKENVIHTLRRFDADGILRISAKKIEIIDKERLLKISKTG